ncbi:hypothetical protein [Cloacibacillus porcorum]|uniref:hypothetical protein n=1 Tax=Cloacibacillus porcorum TaxID=1197717 RepID=UPI0023F12AA1|nr:hypothetical protein [Cloacibacillus porcorum]MCD7877260.1 hypothetical protein [Cloacibacillus porcorum]
MNQETVALIESSQGWRELANAAASGRTPQSVGVTIPHVMQETFAEMYGRLVLKDDSLWNDGKHPDMINAGTLAAPPSIDECRRLQGELALHPLSSQRRLAVVWMAGKLSVEASNSLLKITEEPPEHGNILFMSEEDSLIPTIKSRIWSIHIDLPEEILKSHPMPADMMEWAQWMDSGRKPSPEILYLEMQGWVRDFVDKNDYIKASELDSLIRLMEQRRLSVPVIQDLVFALFKEEVPNEQILGNLW